MFYNKSAALPFFIVSMLILVLGLSYFYPIDKPNMRLGNVDVVDTVVISGHLSYFRHDVDHDYFCLKENGNLYYIITLDETSKGKESFYTTAQLGDSLLKLKGIDTIFLFKPNNIYSYHILEDKK